MKDREAKDLLLQIADALDKQERENMTARELLEEGFNEAQEAKEEQEKEQLLKYLAKDYDDASPLELGSARQKLLEEKQEEARKTLSAEMEQLLKEKEVEKYYKQGFK